MKKIRRRLGRIWKAIRQTLTNPFYVAILQRRQDLKIHLGCGDDHLEGFINVDQRQTGISDVTTDLTKPHFAAGSIAVAFSNAFFEHLYRNTRIPHLKKIYKSLGPNGVCCYIGIPYFKNIARSYLEKKPGYNLYNVYCGTHGLPEQAPSWWLGQLHKSLFDEEEMASLLKESGFTSYAIFCYEHPDDVKGTAVTMGFYASKDNRSKTQLQTDATSFLTQFASKKIQMQTLTWLN